MPRTICNMRHFRLMLLAVVLLAPWRLGADTVSVCPMFCDAETVVEALILASDGDTIALVQGGVHTEPAIAVFRSVEIRGVEGGGTILQAAQAGGSGLRVLTVPAGVTVTIRELTIRNGGFVEDGGAIHNQGSLTLDRVTIEDSVSRRGGGVFNQGDLTLIDTVLDSNQARAGGGIFNDIGGELFADGCDLDDNDALGAATVGGTGGGLHNAGSAQLEHCKVRSGRARQSGKPGGRGGGIANFGDLELRAVELSLNDADEYGGALYQDSGQTTFVAGWLHTNEAVFAGGGIYLENSSFEMRDVLLELSASGESGGGVYVGHGAAIVIEHSTLSNNSSSYGGGLYTRSSTSPRLHNVTMSSNSAVENGGAIYVRGRNRIRIASSTITENVAGDDGGSGTGDGGGIYLGSECDAPFCSLPSWAYLKNSILANNEDMSSVQVDQHPDCIGELISDGYAFVQHAGTNPLTNACTVAGDLTGVILGQDAHLNGLTSNAAFPIYAGGPIIPTHALPVFSLAVGNGNPAGCDDYSSNPLPHDQRYAPRAGNCDIGAFEYGSEPVPKEIFSDGFESGDSTAWSATSP